MSLSSKIQKFLCLGLFAFCVTAPLSANDHIVWRRDLEQAKKIAHAEQKLVLVHFSASWCAACKEIDRFVFVNPMTVRVVGAEVVPLKIDVDLSAHIAKEYGVTTVPYDILITPAGNVISERSSPRSSDGYKRMIEQAKQSASNVPPKVAKEVNQLRKEIRRQRDTHTAQQNRTASYGAAANSDLNQFQNNHENKQGFQTPKFKNPEPWSISQTPAKPTSVNPANPSAHLGIPKMQTRPQVPTPLVPGNDLVTEIPARPSVNNAFAPPPLANQQLPRIRYGNPTQAGTPTPPAVKQTEPIASPNPSQTQERQTLAKRIVNPLYARKQAELAAQAKLNAQAERTAQVAWKQPPSANKENFHAASTVPEEGSPQESTTVIPETVTPTHGFKFDNPEPTLAKPYKAPSTETPQPLPDSLSKTDLRSTAPPRQASNTLRESAQILPRALPQKETHSDASLTAPRGGVFQTTVSSDEAAIPAEQQNSQAESANSNDSMPEKSDGDSKNGAKSPLVNSSEPLATESVAEPNSQPALLPAGTSEPTTLRPMDRNDQQTSEPLATESVAEPNSQPALSPAGLSEPAALQPMDRNDEQTSEPLAPLASAEPASVEPSFALTPKSAPNQPAQKSVGLEGYCCVSLMEQQEWTKGDPQWGCYHRGRLFLFASKEKRDLFQLTPDMFSPLLGGSDPVEFHNQGELVDGKRKHGVFYGEDDGPTVIVLFANAENRAQFEADPAEYLRSVRQAMTRLDSDLLLR